MTEHADQPDCPSGDPFIDEVRLLKREAAERTPTREQLAERLKEIERRRPDTIRSPRESTDAA